MNQFIVSDYRTIDSVIRSPDERIDGAVIKMKYLNLRPNSKIEVHVKVIEEPDDPNEANN